MKRLLAFLLISFVSQVHANHFSWMCAVPPLACAAACICKTKSKVNAGICSLACGLPTATLTYFYLQAADERTHRLHPHHDSVEVNEEEAEE